MLHSSASTILVVLVGQHGDSEWQRVRLKTNLFASFEFRFDCLRFGWYNKNVFGTDRGREIQNSCDIFLNEPNASMSYIFIMVVISQFGFQGLICGLRIACMGRSHHSGM